MFFLLFIIIIIAIVGAIVGFVMLKSSCNDDLNQYIIFFPVAIMIFIGIDITIYNTDDLRWVNSNNVTIEYGMVENLNNNYIKLNNDIIITFDQGKVFNKKYKLNGKKIKIGDIVQYQYIDSELKTYYIGVSPIININDINENK